MTIQQKAEKYHAMFISKTRDNGEDYVILADDASEDLQASIKQAHEDRFPNDWIYGTYADLMQRVTEYDLETFEQLEDVRHEIVDGSVHIYTHQLTAWLASDINNVDYLAQAASDGFVYEDGGWQLLARAQYLAIDEVMSEVMDLLSK